MAVLAISCGSSAPYEGVPRDQPPLAATPGTWTWVDVPGSVCNDGSPTGFAINVQDTSDLFIFFEGGGACWDYLTCVVAQLSTIGPFGATEWATREQMLPEQFDRTRTTNPFRNATMIYVPYCTGDLHIGDNVAMYPGGGSTVTWNHKGLSDSTSFLSRVASTWKDPARVVVSGSSAGGFGAILLYDLTRKTWPQSRMYLIDDAGPLLEGDALPAAEKQAWISAWNIGGFIDDLCAGCQTDFSLLNTTLTKSYPNDRMALLSSLQDATITFFFGLTPATFQTDLLQMVNDRLIPSQAFHPFVITGNQHTLLGTMTTSATNGTVLEPWLDSMINDKSDFVTVLPQ
jgi:hypothetical protein